MRQDAQVQVMVVGAGPAGLMLACELKLAGIDVAVIEKRAAGTGESRAPGINARTMEVLEQRGLAQRFREQGRSLPAVLFSGMPMLPAKIQPDWPDALILPQHVTERILGDHAAQLGVTVDWSTELIHLSQDNDGVALIVHQAGRLHTLRAQYVVGCDGGHSVVRRACGASFDGDDPVSHWLVADVQFDAPPGEHPSFGRNTRVGTYQVSRVEADWYRVSLMTQAPPADRGAPVTLEELRLAMLAGLGTDYGLRTVRWISRFSDGFRQVTQYRHGRVFLAGDAAHTHTPIGGQGLNLGVQDAVNLGWKLAAVIVGGAADALLDSYHDERHPVAQQVLQMSRAQTALIKPGPQIDALRQVVAGMLALPEVTLNLAGMLSGLALRYGWGENPHLHPLVGCRMPNLTLVGDGEHTDVFTLMRKGRPLLLCLDDAVPAVLPARWAALVDVVAAEFPAGFDGATWRLSVIGEVPAIAAAFIRPDGHVAWVSPADAPVDHDCLLEAVQKWLG